MPKKNRPRKGSLAHAPRKRAGKSKPRVRAWPEESEIRLLGFAGYKAGMTHVFMIDDHSGRPTHGQEVNVPVTVLEVPPMRTCAIRVYGEDLEGEKVLTEAWDEDLSKDLERKISISQDYDQDKAFEKAQTLFDNGKAEEISMLVHTQPKLGSVPKKKPEIFEVHVGGNSIEEKWEKSKEMLGKEIKISETFGEGEYADVFAITKGKGFEGPVQRWGVRVQTRKVQKARRHTGVLGPWRPSRIMRSVPMSGQSGYHQRMEYNKRILKIGEDGSEVTPNGGFLRYGEIKSDYAIIKGSVPGPTKRMIFLRRPMREKEGAPSTPPDITLIDTSSQQGG